MNPHDIFCPNIDCAARGQIGKGNIGVHSQKDERYICNECQQTFTTTKGTIFYRLRTEPKTVLLVFAYRASGFPTPDGLPAVSFDEWAVRGRWQRAGKH